MACPGLPIEARRHLRVVIVFLGLPIGRPCVSGIRAGAATGSSVACHSMNGIAAIRKRQKRWTPRILGAWVVLWLVAAFQPCAMALGDHRMCPDCPAGTHEGEMGTAMLVQSDSCTAADCTDMARFDHDSRAWKAEPLKALALVPASWVPEQASAPCPRVYGPIPFEVPSGPPLNVRFCVYLK